MSSAAQSLNERADAIEAAAEALYQEAAALRRLARTMTASSSDIVFVDPVTHRLTEAGAREMDQMFAKGDRVSDIARRFNITQSAVSYRYGAWKTRRARKVRT